MSDRSGHVSDRSGHVTPLFVIGGAVRAVVLALLWAGALLLPESYDDLGLLILGVLALVVAVWGGFDGWRRVELGEIIGRWAIVSLISAVAGPVLGNVLAPDYVDVAPEIAIAIVVGLPAMVGAAAFGGAMGQTISNEGPLA